MKDNILTFVMFWGLVFLLWFSCTLFSSCFVSGRTIEVHTPRVDVTADTATAHTWPYESDGTLKY